MAQQLSFGSSMSSGGGVGGQLISSSSVNDVDAMVVGRLDSHIFTLEFKDRCLLIREDGSDDENNASIGGVIRRSQRRVLNLRGV